MDSRFLDVIVKGDSMWPTLSDGITVRFEKIIPGNVHVGQIILTKHPMKSETIIIKRIKSLSNDLAFVIGDNPDPNASDDSHNFGLIKLSDIFAVMQN
jgi:phage repressor protein C with HTH and peptisase S24 domain|tara:strand:- start:447 stop:740 length:294 start_codon:yes stop_codon:yes gene_type:complete